VSSTNSRHTVTPSGIGLQDNTIVYPNPLPSTAFPYGSRAPSVSDRAAPSFIGGLTLPQRRADETVVRSSSEANAVVKIERDLSEDGKIEDKFDDTMAIIRDRFYDVVLHFRYSIKRFYKCVLFSFDNLFTDIPWVEC
jgi:hypothetical protein